MRAVRVVALFLSVIVAGGWMCPARAETALAQPKQDDWAVTRWLDMAAERYQAEIAGPLSVRQIGPPSSSMVSRFARQVGICVRAANGWIKLWGRYAVEAYNVQIAGTFAWLPVFRDGTDVRVKAETDAKTFTEARAQAESAWRTADMVARAGDAPAGNQREQEAEIRARQAEAKDKLVKKKQELDAHIEEGLKKLEDFEKSEKARKAEELRKAGEAKRAAEALRRAEEARNIEEKRKATETLRLAQLAYMAEVASAEQARKAEEQRKSAEARRLAAEKIAAVAAQAKAETDRKIDAARKAQEAERQAREAYAADVAKAEKARLLREERIAAEQRAKAEPVEKAAEKTVAEAKDGGSKPAKASSLVGDVSPPLPKAVAGPAPAGERMLPSATSSQPQRVAAAVPVATSAKASKIGPSKDLSRVRAKREAVSRPKRIAKGAQGHKRRTVVYVVRRGDTLWKIARRYYHSGHRYAAVYRANRGAIRNPDHIIPGQVLRVPRT